MNKIYKISLYDDTCTISGTLNVLAPGTGIPYAFSVRWSGVDGREFTSFGNTRAECDAKAMDDIKVWRAQGRANAAAEVSE